MKYLLVFYMLISAFCSFADVPGNKPRPDYDLTCTGIRQYEDYLFFWQQNNVVRSLKDSGIIKIQGGYGEPQCVEVWAINRKNFKHTDTLYFCSGDQDASMNIILQITDYHLRFEKSEPPKKSKKTQQVILSAENSSPTNHLFMLCVISVSSLLVLISLIYFIRRNKTQTKLQQSI